MDGTSTVVDGTSTVVEVVEVEVVEVLDEELLDVGSELFSAVTSVAKTIVANDSEARKTTPATRR